MTTKMNTSRNVVIADPPFAVDLFNNTRWAWLWLLLRLYVGYTWLSSGLEKIGNPAWTQTGEGLRAFWERAVQVPEPPARPAIAFDWYRSFIETLLNAHSYVWFAKLVVAGELLVGIALILGAFVGIAAFIGAFMNWNFMMAGTASINPLMFVFTILLILAWKTAGWYGLDRWLLPMVGTPWMPPDRIRKDAVPVTGPEESARITQARDSLEEDPYDRSVRQMNQRVEGTGTVSDTGVERDRDDQP